MNTRLPRELTPPHTREPLFRVRLDGAVSLRIPTYAVALDTLARSRHRGVALDLISTGSADEVLHRNEDGSTSITLAE